MIQVDPSRSLPIEHQTYSSHLLDHPHPRFCWDISRYSRPVYKSHYHSFLHYLRRVNIALREEKDMIAVAIFVAAAGLWLIAMALGYIYDELKLIRKAQEKANKINQDYTDKVFNYQWPGRKI